MKNVFEIEKRNVAKEIVEKLKKFFNNVEVNVYNGCEEATYELNDKIDELLEEFLK